MSAQEYENAQALQECLACGSLDLEKVIDLGDQPLANSFSPNGLKLEKFPLQLNFCADCSHLQLSHNVKRTSLFEDYLYVSGTTSTLRNDFADFALEMTEKHGVGRVLDIACNDGSQLDAFKELGWQTVGIDPAKNLFPVSSIRHEVYCDFLNESHLTLGKFDIVVAQNVLAHTDNPLEFLKIAAKLGTNIYIQTSQAHMVFENQFDTIYHEHLSFFSEKSMAFLAKRSGLVLTDVTIRKIHGNSFLFQLSMEGIEFNPEKYPNQETIALFRDSVTRIITDLRSTLLEVKSTGLPVVGYGAAAKGMTLLNAVGVPLDFIVDDSPYKQGLYTPGLNIPIVSATSLTNLGTEIYLIPLAWNFADEILKRVNSSFSGLVHLIKYFPDVKVE
jgi:SAM-dependent methyltransferase